MEFTRVPLTCPVCGRLNFVRVPTDAYTHLRSGGNAGTFDSDPFDGSGVLDPYLIDELMSGKRVCEDGCRPRPPRADEPEGFSEDEREGFSEDEDLAF